VAAVRAAGHRVVPLPGASSVAAALSAAGDALGAGFRFIGFAPTKAAEREALLRTLTTDDATLLLFEAPHRIEALCTALAQQMPDRTVSLCRELTKQFEQIETLAAAALPAWLAENDDRRRGEFVLVLHAQAPSDDDTSVAAAERLLGLLLDALPLKQAVAITAEATGAPRNALYARALARRDAGA
jgi:16S rRNA (cytidine1402-2'-O)-methyltransferase